MVYVRDPGQCDWLLNHNGEDSEQATVVGSGLDPGSSVYRAIMSSDVIQLALMNPRTLTGTLYLYLCGFDHLYCGEIGFHVSLRALFFFRLIRY